MWVKVPDETHKISFFATTDKEKATVEKDVEILSCTIYMTLATGYLCPAHDAQRKRRS